MGGGAVQVLPAHGGDLATAHGGLDGPYDNGTDLAAVDLCYGQEAGMFVVDETACPSVGAPGFADQFNAVTLGLHTLLFAGYGKQMGE